MSNRFAAIRKVTAATCAGVLLVAAAQMLFVCATTHFTLSGLVLSTLAIIIAVGLLRGSPISHRIAAAICLLSALFLPIAIFNPFAVGDYLAQSKDPPHVASTLLWLIPLELALLGTVFVLDRRKS